jgi:hypothetical protein
MTTPPQASASAVAPVSAKASVQVAKSFTSLFSKWEKPAAEASDPSSAPAPAGPVDPERRPEPKEELQWEDVPAANADEDLRNAVKHFPGTLRKEKKPAP